MKINYNSYQLGNAFKSCDVQFEVLAERLAELPKTVSAAPLYKQMERLEALKAEAQSKERTLSENQNQALPVELSTYEAYLDGLKALANAKGFEEIKTI